LPVTRRRLRERARDATPVATSSRGHVIARLDGGRCAAAARRFSSGYGEVGGCGRRARRDRQRRGASGRRRRVAHSRKPTWWRTAPGEKRGLAVALRALGAGVPRREGRRHRTEEASLGERVTRPPVEHGRQVRGAASGGWRTRRMPDIAAARRRWVRGRGVTPHRRRPPCARALRSGERSP